MGLRVIKVRFAKVHGVKAGIHIALECQQCLFGIFWGERWSPAAEACRIEPRELVGQMHQLANLLRAQFAQLFDQLLGVVQVLRLGETRSGRRRLVIEGFSG